MTSDSRDYYEILGVSNDASFEEIRSAFRERAWENHPDRNTSADAVDRMQEINEAYEVLRDEEQRAAYDRARRTFTASKEELAKAKDLAVFTLGQLAFGFGYDIGAGTAGRRSDIPIGRIEDVPTGMWHAVYEVALESALVGESFLLGPPPLVWEAAQNAVENEAARYTYRHALSERATSVTEAIVIDLSVHCLGLTASAVGAQLGANNSFDGLESEAWRRAFEAIQYGAASEMARRGGFHAMRGARDNEFLDSVMEEAARRGFESFSMSVRRERVQEAFMEQHVGSRSRRSERGVEGTAEEIGAVFGFGCAALTVILLFFLGITLLGRICAVVG